MLSNMDEPTTQRALRGARRRETWSLSVHTLADAPPSQRTSPEVALASIVPDLATSHEAGRTLPVE